MKICSAVRTKIALLKLLYKDDILALKIFLRLKCVLQTTSQACLPIFSSQFFLEAESRSPGNGSGTLTVLQRIPHELLCSLQ